MALKFVVVLCLMGLALAGEYEYNQPNALKVQLAEANGGSSSGNNQNNNNNNNNINSNDNSNLISISTNENLVSSSFSAGGSIDNSQATPYGYDYQPQQYNSAPLYNAPAKYEYSYSVHDELTGDIKSHSESRDGYLVRGVYTVVDPDGFKRIVSYTADDLNGFNAVVNREPYALKAAVTPATTVVAAKSQLLELPLSGQKLEEQTTLQQSQQAHSESSHVDLPVQTHDSYAAPLPAHKDGVYA